MLPPAYITTSTMSDATTPIVGNGNANAGFEKIDVRLPGHCDFQDLELRWVKHSWIMKANIWKEPWFLTAVFWKRFSVVLSILLSAASLILSAIANFKNENADMLKCMWPPPRNNIPLLKRMVSSTRGCWHCD